MKKKNILLVMASLLLMLGVCGFIFIKSQKTVEVDMSIVDIIVRNSVTANSESGSYDWHYKNKTVMVTATQTSVTIPLLSGGSITITIKSGDVIGAYTYCKHAWFRKCFTDRNGYTSFK